MAEMTVQQALEFAVQQHRAGRTAEAEAIYLRILEIDPRHLGALQMLARLHYEGGRGGQAADALERAIAIDPQNPDLLSNLSAVLAGLGKLDDATTAVRKALSLRPDSPETHGNLGNILLAKGEIDDAIASYRQALVLNPTSVESLINLGNALRKKGDLPAALENYRRAVELRPDSPESRLNLAHALKDANRFDESIVAYREGILLRPESSQIHVELAHALQEVNRFDEAIAAYHRAIALRPDAADAWHGLGVTFGRTLKPDQAIAAFKEAVRHRPDFADAHSHLGIALYEMGLLEESIAAHRQAIANDPNFVEAYNNLGLALQAAERTSEAVCAFKQALSLRSNYPEALNNLGLAYEESGNPDDAIGAYRRALVIQPGFVLAQNNLANVLKDTGQLDEAIGMYRAAAEGSNLPWVHGNLLFALHAHPDYGPKDLYREHVRWADRFAKPLALERKPHANDRSPDRRLRVGLASPDFNEHPVGRFLLPLLQNIDRSKVEIICYSDGRRRDWVSDALEGLADQWRKTTGVSDARLAEVIREDAIDILIDLTMHTKGNRMLVFARKPAPVQATYLAFCSTTGVDAIDYRMTDPYLDPPGTEDGIYCEKSVRLPHSYWCYQAPPEAGVVAPLPAERAGSITFGCLNTFSKVTPFAITAWAQILKNVQGSRLLLHSREGTHRQRVIESFRKAGVEPGRIQCVTRAHRPDYFKLYDQMDIALDPFPFPGGATTCDALWMGVPVVTLKGRTAVSRGGVSILSNVGLMELIADSPEAYVELATTLAGNRPRLSGLRTTMRARMLGSPLMNVPAFARGFEAALREMWREWCASAQT